MKLSKAKIKQGILGLMAMTMVFSTSSAITVYADEGYNGDQGGNAGAGIGNSVYTFTTDNPCKQGLRVTFLNGTELMYKDKPSCVDICYSTHPSDENKNNVFYDTNKLGNAKAKRLTSFTVGAEGNDPDLKGLPAPIGWSDTGAGKGDFISNGLAIKDYLYPDDTTKTKHMNTLLTACFGKDALDDFRNAKEPRVVLEAIAWYIPVSTSKKQVGSTVYGTTSNWAEFNSNPTTIKLLGNTVGGYTSSISNKALPFSMILSEDDPILKLIVPGIKEGKEIPTRDLL